MNDASRIALLGSLLRDEGAALSTLERAEFAAALVDCAIDHGVASLLRHHLKTNGTWNEAPLPFRHATDQEVRKQSLLELTRREEVRSLSMALSQRGVISLLLKGAALAYTHYPAPYLRPCIDIDVLVAKPDVQSAEDALKGLGYRRKLSVSREAIHAQLTFERVARSFRHVVDLHWKISNRPLFANMLSFQELAEHAVPVETIGASALAPGPVHALLLACIHRVAHHNDMMHLIWLYDIRLLAERLTGNEWDCFWNVATEKRVVMICLKALELTSAFVGIRTDVSARVTTARSALGSANEPSSAYIGGVDSQWRNLALDISASGGILGKVRLIASHAFPDPVYMKGAYDAKNAIGLATAYFRRAVTGAWRAMTVKPRSEP